MLRVASNVAQAGRALPSGKAALSVIRASALAWRNAAFGTVSSNTVPASRAGGLIGSTEINPRPDASAEVDPSPTEPASAAVVVPACCGDVDELEAAAPEVVPVVDPVPEVCDDVDEPDELPPVVVPAAVLPDPCVVADEPEVVVPPRVVPVPVPVPLCHIMPPEVVPVVDPAPEVCDDVDEPDELPPVVVPAAVLPDPCVVADEPEVVVPPRVVPVVDPVPEVCDDVDEPDALPPEVAPPEVGEGAGGTTTTGIASAGAEVGELTNGRFS